MKKKKEFEAVGVVEIILILVVLIALVVIFRDQITSLMNNAFSKISTDATKIIG